MDPEDIELAYTGEPLAGDVLTQAITDGCPDVLLPGGYCAQRSAAAIIQSKDGNAMSATFVIVSRSKQVNRNGNQLQLLATDQGKGPVTDYFAQNPVVLYDHGFSGISLPVGRCQKPDGSLALTFNKSKGVGTCYFSQLPHAEPIYAAVDDGLLKMASIGFNGLKALRIQRPQLPQTTDPSNGGVIDMQWAGLDFVEWELLEWSITPIGADRGALRQCLDRGKINDVTLPLFLRQSFEQYAEQPKAWSPGFDFKRIQSLGAVIEGPLAAVEQIEQAIASASAAASLATSIKQSATVVTHIDAQPVVDRVSPPPIDPQTLAQAYQQRVDHEAVQHVTQAVVTGLKTVVQRAVKPVADELAKHQQRLKQMTGRLD